MEPKRKTARVRRVTTTVKPFIGMMIVRVGENTPWTREIFSSEGSAKAHFLDHKLTIQLKLEWGDYRAVPVTIKRFHPKKP